MMVNGFKWISIRPKKNELVNRYGEIKNFVWENEKKFMTFYKIPEQLTNSFLYNGKSLDKIYVNRDMIEPLDAALNCIIAHGVGEYIKSFDGCFAIRNSRGLNTLSTHSYGLAIDLNASENVLGSEPKMHYLIVSIFEACGFIWGGRWSRKDGMHFQFVDT